MQSDVILHVQNETSPSQSHHIGTNPVVSVCPFAYNLSSIEQIVITFCINICILLWALLNMVMNLGSTKCKKVLG